MSTSWTRTAGEICIEGLMHLGVQARGQTVPPENMQTALDALDSVLKELPLFGYTWPTLSARTSLTWPALTLPTDFYGYLQVWSDGRPLQRMKTSDYNELTDLTQTGSTASHFYQKPDGSIYLWPVPTSDPVITIAYQRLVDDVVQGTAPNVPTYMVNGLGYGVAYELLEKFDTPEPKAGRIEKKWKEKRMLMLMNAVSGEAISFSVADDRIDWGPGNWQAPTPIPDGWDAGQEP